MNSAFDARALDLASTQLSRGEARGAVETLRAVLSRDPELSVAHALLALALTELKRVFAAEKEARLALALDPQSGLAHLALAVAYLGQRKFGPSERHLQTALEIDPESIATLRQLAALYKVWRKPERAASLLERARAQEPQNADVLADLAELALERGEVDAAAALAESALHVEPAHRDALIAMGTALLRRGAVEPAREHALWALRQDPTDVAAVRLLASVRAQRSPLLGAWWRYAAWMSSIGMSRSVLVLTVAYVAQWLGRRAALDGGAPELARAIYGVWIAMAVYTWLGPALFLASIKKELAAVSLRVGF